MTRARPTSTTARGYTAIEVLMAMTVMAIGGAAVITMQKTSVTANLDARRADVANSIARTWVERLRRDGMAWTSPGPESTAQQHRQRAAHQRRDRRRPATGISPTSDARLHRPRDDEPRLRHPRARPAAGASSRSPTSASTSGSRGSTRRRCLRAATSSGPTFASSGRSGSSTRARASATRARRPGRPEHRQRRADVHDADPNAPVFHALYLTTTIRENTAP